MTSPAMEPGRLEEIRAREKAATEGPWEWNADEGCFESVAATTYVHEHGGYERDFAQSTEDMDFIAHAREDIPALLAEVERLRAENAALKPKTDCLRSRDSEIHGEDR